MPSPDLWNCPRCGQLYRLDEPSCGVCRVTRENRDVIGKTSVLRSIEKEAQAVEVHLPYVIQEARFNLPLADGQSLWTHGCVAAGEGGLYLISENDGLDPLEVARGLPPGPAAVGSASVFLPAETIVRIVHEKLIGFWIEFADRKIPLRLPKGGWEELDLLCDHFGIRHT